MTEKADSAQTQTVIVLGNARSGTSMVAGILSVLGVDLRPVHNPHPQVPKGSFEDLAFIDLTRRIQMDRRNGASQEELLQNYQQQAEELIQPRSGLWGWKSALTHYCLDILLPVVSNPRFVVVFRNLLYNAQSYVIHNAQMYGQNMSLEASLKQMATGATVITEVLEAHQSVPRVFTTYEDLKKDPLQEARKIADFLHIFWDESFEEEIQQLILQEYSTLKECSNL